MKERGANARNRSGQIRVEDPMIRAREHVPGLRLPLLPGARVNSVDQAPVDRQLIAVDKPLTTMTANDPPPYNDRLCVLFTRWRAYTLIHHSGEIIAPLRGAYRRVNGLVYLVTAPSRI